ncbi:MAG: restriction endonuclease [Alphaproteobacteria bacterium]|nr:restriction endonuclease [Alphaproteobacteria bacterium]
MQDGKKRISKLELRAIIEQELASTIEWHRSSRQVQDESYVRPTGQPTDDELDDFILTNPLFDEEIATQLIDPGLLGFGYPSAQVEDSIFEELRDLSRQWAQTNEWIAADLVPYRVLSEIRPTESRHWDASAEGGPKWLVRAPSNLILAAELLKRGKLLSELIWRQFEEVIGEVLEREGWYVDLTRPSKDGGIDLYASKDDPSIGKLRSIWQAKKYGENKKVQLSAVRELSGVLQKSGATKGVLVTTSHLTRGALDWVKQDVYRLDYKDKEQIEAWIRRHA